MPGGPAGTMRALADQRLAEYGRAVAAPASVRPSSLILGAAGLLTGRKATTHWAFLETLREYGAVPVKRRWVDHGGILTAAGVAAGIDMALHLAARFAGEDIARSCSSASSTTPTPRSAASTGRPRHASGSGACPEPPCGTDSRPSPRCGPAWPRGCDLAVGPLGVSPTVSPGRVDGGPRYRRVCGP
ncbi:DJ-1/PfpI family protein [Amycolatopsis thermophila]|uniref:DJ-1/PfpI family protein n=1 Tax=Amycolatopsis thermophila TaxID=206084 RepID=UPI003520AC68